MSRIVNEGVMDLVVLIIHESNMIPLVSIKGIRNNRTAINLDCKAEIKTDLIIRMKTKDISVTGVYGGCITKFPEHLA